MRIDAPSISPARKPFDGKTAQQILDEHPAPLEHMTRGEGVKVRGPETAKGGYDRVSFKSKADIGEINTDGIQISGNPQRIEVQQYYHSDPQGKYPSNWRINVTVGSGKKKMEFVAVLPEDYDGGPFSLRNLELVPKKRFQAAGLAEKNGTATPDDMDLLERGHFVSGHYDPSG